jgi:hypothetical protein
MISAEGQQASNCGDVVEYGEPGSWVTLRTIRGKQNEVSQLW